MPRLAVAMLLAFLFVSGATAQQRFDDPVALVEAAYAPYLAGSYADYPVELFSPTLRQLWDDAMARSEEMEMPVLDFDPFVNGQDFEVSDLVVADPAIDGDKAVAAVSFLNFGAPQDLRFLLVRDEGGWKIDDIEQIDGDYPWRLSEILAADPLLN